MRPFKITRIQKARLRVAKRRWAKEDAERALMYSSYKPRYTVNRRSRPVYVHRPKSYVFEAVLIALLFFFVVVALLFKATA